MCYVDVMITLVYIMKVQKSDINNHSFSFGTLMYWYGLNDGMVMVRWEMEVEKGKPSLENKYYGLNFGDFYLEIWDFD